MLQVVDNAVFWPKHIVIFQKKSTQSEFLDFLGISEND